MSHFITSLDIGSAQIKCIVAAQKKDGTFSIITAFKQPSVGIRKGVIVDAGDATEVLRNVATDLERLSKRAAQNVFVNMQSEYVRARPSRGIVAVTRVDQKILQDDIERVTQASRAIKLLPNYLVLHNIIREYLVDEVGNIEEPVGMTGNRLEVNTLIIDAFAPHVNLLARTLERAGMGVGGIIFNPLAASRAVLSKRARELGVVLVDIGGGTTSLVVYEENKVVHAKSFPIGSGYVTNDIAIGLKVSIDTAEQLKIAHGSAIAKDISRRDAIRLSELEGTLTGDVSKRFLAEIIEVRLAEIFELIHNELKYLGKLQLPAGVVITGGGIKLHHMPEFVKQQLKLPVQVGYPLLTAFEVPNPAHEELLSDPEFATALGLVLWGTDEVVKSAPISETIKHFFRNLMP